jgi:hypothetical protein
VRLPFAVVPAFAERATVTHDDRTDRRIRRGFGARAGGQFDSPREIRRVRSVYGLTSTPFQNAM